MNLNEARPIQDVSQGTTPPPNNGDIRGIMDIDRLDTNTPAGLCQKLIWRAVQLATLQSRATDRKSHVIVTESDKINNGRPTYNLNAKFGRVQLTPVPIEVFNSEGEIR